MKKALSLILAVMMLLGCMSVTAFATDNNTTEITATVANSLSYEMVIPPAVSMTEAGVKEIGTPSVENVKHATANTVISYTATGTQLTLEGGSKTMATSYYTDSTGTTAMPSTAIEVYKSKALVDPLTTLYVGISADAWNAAENGTYKATVTFNFAAEEKAAATCEVDTKTNALLYRVVKIDDGNVILARYSSFDGFDAVWTMGESKPKEEAKKLYGTELAVGDCFHQVGSKWEKCIAPETHGLYNKVVIGSIELSSYKFPFVVPAGATYSINDNNLYVHYGEKQHYVDVGQCSWTLNGANLSNGDTGTINDGDAFVGTKLPN